MAESKNVRSVKAYASTLEMIGVGAREEQAKYRAKSRPRRSSSDPTRLVEVQPGMVPFSSVQTLADKLGVAPAELLAVIGVSERTAARRRIQGFLEPEEADRLLRVARVVEEATRIFGSEEKAAVWLNTPHPILEDAEPLTLLNSDAGTKTVTDELTRIDFGDFA